MYKHRLRVAMAYYEALVNADEKPAAADAKKELIRLRTQIEFFQHERLIHLIVTVLFGLAVIITIPFNLLLLEPALMLLSGLLLVLLVPYIVHYYHLENGVQTLYKYYDRLELLAEDKLNEIYKK